MRIRPATTEDARPIAEVHVASWRHAYRGLLPDDYLDKFSVDEREALCLAWFADPGPSSGVLVAEDDAGRVVGFATFGPSRDDDAPTGTGEVPAIYVDPAELGTGIGRAALRGDGGRAPGRRLHTGDPLGARGERARPTLLREGRLDLGRRGQHPRLRLRERAGRPVRGGPVIRRASARRAARSSRARRDGCRRTTCDRAGGLPRRTRPSGTPRPRARRRRAPGARSWRG